MYRPQSSARKAMIIKNARRRNIRDLVKDTYRRFPKIMKRLEDDVLHPREPKRNRRKQKTRAKRPAGKIPARKTW